MKKNQNDKNPRFSKEDYYHLLKIAICNRYHIHYVPDEYKPYMKLTAKLLVARDNIDNKIEELEAKDPTWRYDKINPETGKEELRPIIKEWDKINTSIGMAYKHLDIIGWDISYFGV